MLINAAYFIGDLNIPNTGKTEVAELLDWYIQKYEPEFLQKVLGYQFYKNLLAGLQETTVAQKWVDLLEGKEYTGLDLQLTKWRGLISQPLDLINAIDAANSLVMIVGRGLYNYDAVADASSAPLPTELIGKDFIIEQRGIGELRPDEYSIDVDDNIVLTPGKTFTNGDTYFYKSTSLLTSVVTGSSNKSAIANYIWYWFMRGTVTSTSGIGEVVANAENADVVSPVLKMCRAWNEMVDWIKELVTFLDANTATYPEWLKVSHCLSCSGVWYWYYNKKASFTYINPYF
jgi:hypothetical protein